jgi:hypothetical protein
LSSKRLVRFAITLVVSLLVLPLQSPAQEKSISAAADRLKQTLEKISPYPDDKPALVELLGSSEEALRTGRLLLSLYRLQSAWVRISGAEFRARYASVKTRPAYEKEWRRSSREIAAMERKLDSPAANRLPAVVRAFSQSSRLQSRPYYRSGRLYGFETTLDLGFYYMGVAMGCNDFALFCRQLSFEEAPPSLKFRAVTAELDALEAEVLNAFEKADLKSQSGFIPVNATLKLAGELNKAKWFEGATQKYLETWMLFAVLTMAQPDEARIPEIKHEIESARARLKASAADQSIGLLYVEMAEGAMAQFDEGKRVENLKRAAAIVEKVLPRYFEYLSEGDR